MREHARLLLTYMTEKAAGEQQVAADGIRPGFTADAERRERWATEEACARGLWKARNNAAWLATKEFLARNK